MVSDLYLFIGPLAELEVVRIDSTRSVKERDYRVMAMEGGELWQFYVKLPSSGAVVDDHGDAQ